MIFLEKKRKRGKSRGKGLHNILEANGGSKMPIIFDGRFQVPNDDKVAARFTSEIGNIIRTSAPVCYLRWSKVPLDEKRKMRESLLVSSVSFQSFIYYNLIFYNTNLIFCVYLIYTRFYLMWTYPMRKFLNMWIRRCKSCFLNSSTGCTNTI